ncbi:MAG TPA: PilZ domain-containing protein [Terriglobia bacterium]|nr:PilZ domain-containing protein [Terriglobia bacterium]
MKSSKRQQSGNGRSSQRAQRFPIKVPMRYRKDQEKDWAEGRTENISQSGLLFQAPEPLNPDTMVQICFSLPDTAEGESGATVLCEGRTIRTILPPSSDESPCVAVKLLDYKLKRAE